MDRDIILIYCIVNEILKVLGIREDKRVLMTNAEVITTVIVAAFFFQGNQERARIYLQEYGYIPNMLSKSRLNRRIHALGWEFFIDLQNILGTYVKRSHTEFVVDSFPVSICHNIRIRRCHLVQDPEYRGYNHSKRSYFYGVKVHVITTCSGIPVEIFISPGSWHDAKAFKEFELDLPEGSTLYGDKGYTDYEAEDILTEAINIDLASQRKDSHKRQHSGPKAFLINVKRKIIETVFSRINMLLPKKIHAVTLKGFLTKVAAFILGSNMHCFQ